MTDIEVRRATPGDAPTLARMNRFVHGLHVAAHPDFFRDTDLDELTAWFREALEDPATAAFLASVPDGTAVGYVVTREHARPPTALHHERRHLELDEIAVDPEHRRHGVARALVAQVREDAHRRGINRIQLSTWSFNDGARAFFESEGFAPRLTSFWLNLE